MCAAALMLGYCSGPLGDWRLRRVTEPYFQPLPPEARDALTAKFRAVWRWPEPQIAAADWQAAGFDAATGYSTVDGYLRLSEPAGGVTGKGSYLLRSGTQGSVLLEAPHGSDDLYTGEIAQKLFGQFPFAGAGFNSLSRWSFDRDARYGDLARRDDTAFIAFGAAFLAEHRDGVIVQIHGFDSGRHGEASFADADIVLSDGTAAPSARTLGYRDCLEQVLPGRILLYPTDTSELGGTRNATGKLAREAGGRFLHLELSLALRTRLRGDVALRARFAGCLLGVPQP